MPNLKPPNKDSEELKPISSAQQNLALNYDQTTGSVKINDALHALIKAAVEDRIESVEQYTQSRIDRINKNWKIYYSEKSAGEIADQGSTQSVYPVPTAWNAANDHIDDYVNIFSNFVDQIEVYDYKKTAEQYVHTVMKINEEDEDPKTAKLRALWNIMPKEEQEKALQHFDFESISDDSDSFYYKRKAAVKSFCQHILDHSGYQDHIDEAFEMFTVTGHLVLRDNYSSDYETQLVRGAMNDFVVEIDRTPKAKFTPVDTRNLIFGPSSDWTVEKIHIRFSELINRCFDENMKPVPDCPYDAGQLKKVAEFIRNNGASRLKEAAANDAVLQTIYDSDTQDNYADLFDIDGDITIYEAHNIPVVLPGGRVYRCVVSGVNIDAVNNSNQIPFTPNLFIIGCRKSPYINGKAHIEINFFNKKDDRAGLGVIDIISQLHALANQMQQQMMDLTSKGRRELTFINDEDNDIESQTKTIGDRTYISVKVQRGQKIQDMIMQWPTDYSMVTWIQNMMPVIENQIKTASRKGASGEKMSPNPTATEFQQIAMELQKSVNRVAIKINNFLKQFIERAYIYTVINLREKKVNIDVQMERLQSGGNLVKTSKSIPMSAEELFIDGVKFKLKAYDNFEKSAQSKQQMMQIVNLLFTTGMIRNPATGQAATLTDENGNQYQVSDYMLVKSIFDMFNFPDVLVKSNTNLQQQQQQQQQQAIAPTAMPGPQTGSEEVPSLTASTDQADILNSVAQMSQGVNV